MEQFLHAFMLRGFDSVSWAFLYYHAMLRRARICYGKVARPSVCYVKVPDHIGWKSSKIISQLVSLGFTLSADPNITDLLQGEHAKILA